MQCARLLAATLHQADTPSTCIALAILYKLPIMASYTRNELPTIHLLRIVDIEQKWTVWKLPVLPQSTHDNENDSGISRRRTPKE
jgi:hypothetical protein